MRQGAWCRIGTQLKVSVFVFKKAQRNSEIQNIYTLGQGPKFSSSSRQTSKSADPSRDIQQADAKNVLGKATNSNVHYPVGPLATLLQ